MSTEAYAIPLNTVNIRKVMSSFMTGVAIVTAGTKNDPVGMTANSLTSVSLNPPLILVCLMLGARTAQMIDTERKFTINILRREQRTLAKEFARRGVARDSDVLYEHRTGFIGIKEPLAKMDCVLFKKIEAGDHNIYIGEVQSIEHWEGRPLVFGGGGFCDLLDDEGLANANLLGQYKHSVW